MLDDEADGVGLVVLDAVVELLRSASRVGVAGSMPGGGTAGAGGGSVALGASSFFV